MPKLKLQNVRLAFPALFKPQGFNDGTPAYGAKLIIDPANKKMVAAIDAAVKQAAYDQPKWKGQEDKILAKLVKDDVVCFHKSEYENKNGEVYGGFEDMFFISCRSEKLKPLVIDRDKSPLVESDGRPYSGCYVNVSLDIYAQDNTYGRRINCNLSGVQFYRDGDSFGGGTPASADEFEDLSDGVDDDELENDLA